MRLGLNTRKIGAAEVVAASRPLNSNEPYAGRSGDINAGSRTELMQKMVEIASRLQNGDFESPVAEVASSEERTQVLRAAYEDRAGTGFADLGASIAAEISEHATRAGFCRRLLTRADVAQGSIPRVRARQRNVDAVIATGPVQVATQVVRDKYLYPSEFDIVAYPMIEQREINQGNGDVLQEKFLETQEAFMVVEDRVVKRLMDVAAPIYNNIQYFSGTVTPTTIKQTQQQVQTWSLPANSMVMAMDLMTDLATGSTFSTFVDPVSKLEIILTGRLGTLFGMDLLTDGYRDPRLQVLDQGEFYITSTPDYVGAYSDRGPIQSEPRNNTGNFPGRGWYMFESMSISVANAKGVARGKRV